MREIQASEAKTHLPRLLDDVERGETLVITRHGKPVARLIPEPDQYRTKAERALADIADFRKTMPRIALADLLSARHDGHKS